MMTPNNAEEVTCKMSRVHISWNYMVWYHDTFVYGLHFLNFIIILTPWLEDNFVSKLLVCFLFKLEIYFLQLLPIFGSLLSDKSHQPWDKIIKTQTKTGPLENLKEGLHDMQERSLKYHYFITLLFSCWPCLSIIQGRKWNITSLTPRKSPIKCGWTNSSTSLLP